MKRYLSWALVVIVSIAFAFPATAAETQQAEHIWVLVDVVDYDNAEKWAVANENPAYQSSYSCEEGSFSVLKNYMGRTEDWRNTPMVHGEGVRITADFSNPPQTLKPGEEVAISLNISASENTLSFFTFSGSAKADFEKPDVAPGSRSRNAVQFTNNEDETHFEVGAKNSYSAVNETLVAAPPSGREEGEQIALRQQFYMGISMGTYYIYEWREQGYQPTITPGDGTYPNTDPDPSFAGDPEMKRSGVHITDLYGEVLIELYDDDGHYVDSYTPVLGEELAVNAVIITSVESGAQLSLRDMKTFVIKSNSMIEIGDQTETESRIGRFVGHVWVNVKQMMTDGSMDIEMSQAVAGIKGTTFILEDDGDTSTVKVFEGEVEFTPLGGGEPVLVKDGQKLSVSKSMVGTAEGFDTDSELSNWNENVQSITKEAMEVKNTGGAGGVLVVLLAIAGLLITAAVVIVIIRIRKKDAAAMNESYGYGQQTTGQVNANNQTASHNAPSESKFCKHCGKPVSGDSRFCAGCGQSLT